jgi:effector-binding domain-containing protein
MKKFFLIILVILVLGIVAALIWLSTLDGNYHVKRNITFHKSVTEVFEMAHNFNKWTSWSPWLCIEPSAQVQVSGTGKDLNDKYSWQGELVGEGIIEHKKIDYLKGIEQEITFLKPMESHASVYWEFDTLNDSMTTVTWGMTGEMPFLLRFMTKMMEPWIGMDYERGLKMMKDMVEKGYVASNVEIIGLVDAPAIKFVGEKVNCSLNDLGDSMQEVFPRLSEKAAEKSLVFDTAMSIYHEYDFVKRTCGYTAAIIPLSGQEELGAPYYADEIPAVKALKIKFTGDYEHIGNAWAAGMSYMRTYKISENKDVASYEVYITGSNQESDERKWVTEVYMPVK